MKKARTKHNLTMVEDIHRQIMACFQVEVVDPITNEFRALFDFASFHLFFFFFSNKTKILTYLIEHNQIFNKRKINHNEKKKIEI
jgi:hypothetical protein